MSHRRNPSEMTASELLAAQVQAHRLRILENLPGTLQSDDPEPLHRVRTSTRRLRSYVKLCRGVLPGSVRRASSSELAWLGRTLGPARDLDVMLQELPGLLAADGDLPGEFWLAELTGWLALRRRQVGETIAPALGSPRFARLCEQLAAASRPEHSGREASSSAAELLRGRLLVQLGRFVSHADQVSPASPDEQLHRLRILGKRLRYGCELAQPVLPVSAFATALRISHDLLGAHQDAVVAAATVADFAVVWAERPRERCATWQASLASRRAQLRAELLERLPGVLDRLGDPEQPRPGTLAAALG